MNMGVDQAHLDLLAAAATVPLH